MVAGLRSYQFKRFIVGFACFAEAYRFNASVPFQGIVSEQGLFITDDDGLGTVCSYIIFQLIHPLYIAFYKKTTPREPNILVDFQVHVYTQLVLFGKKVGSIRLGNLADLLVEIRRGSQRQ